MGKIKEIKEIFTPKSRGRRNESRKPLIENNNNAEAEYDREVSVYDNLLDQDTFNTHEEGRLQVKEDVTVQELVKLLQVQPDAVSDASEDGFYCSTRPESHSGQHKIDPGVALLIRRSVSGHFPKPPADLDQNLRQHLMNVQNVVLGELTRLGLILEPMGLMGYLVDVYHQQTCDHLHSLLQHVSSSQNLLVLINWGLKTYLSQELLGHPELKDMDAIKKVDHPLFREWGEKAKEKLLENVQKEVGGSLEKILLHEKDQGCDSDEALVRLYVDTIACIDAMPTEAQKISPDLSCKVQEVCFQQLLIFVKSYKDEQTELLQEKTKTDEPEMIHFFKTLITCEKLTTYIQTKDIGVRTVLCGDIVNILQDMEAFTLKLLMKIVTNITESHLKDYFSKENKQFFFLIDVVKINFAKLENHPDVQERVMNEAYKIIVRSYIEHLIKIKLNKLRKCWSFDVGQTVVQDARLLHGTMSDLAPAVQQWNLRLLKIAEMLHCNDTDALKLTVAEMQNDSLTRSEDVTLLHRLLRWKGLPQREVREVLDAIPGDYQPRSRSGSWYSCLTCW